MGFCLLPEHLATKIRENAATGCWEWTGALNNKGYGRTGRRSYSHRVVYELLVGPIPEGLELDHLCRVPACANPDHLEPVTHKENMRRGHRPESDRTHCPAGHPYSPENTYLFTRANGNVFRQCKACTMRRAREWKRGRPRSSRS